MDLLNVKYTLIKAKQANIRINPDRICIICGKKIADNEYAVKVFDVYPNGYVVHHNCINKEEPNVCPFTYQDFEKTFKF